MKSAFNSDYKSRRPNGKSEFRRVKSSQREMIHGPIVRLRLWFRSESRPSHLSS